MAPRAITVLSVVALFAACFVQSQAKVSAISPLKLDALLSRHDTNIPDYVAETIRKYQEQLINLRRLLAAADANVGCLTERDAKLYAALEALEAARKCIFSGLPTDYYYALKDRCLSLPSAKADVKVIYDKCDQYSGTSYHKCRSTEYIPATNCVNEIDGVCKRVSLGPYGPKSCAAIDPLQAQVDALRQTDCGTGVYTRKELEAAIADIIAKIRALVDGPIPSDDPRFFNVPL